MYKFLPEQIENLKKQLETEKMKYKGIVELKKESFAEKKLGEESRVQEDSVIIESFITNTNTLNEIRSKLLNCEIIEPNYNDEIGIGSTFEISLFFEDEEDKSVFTLVETRLPKDPANFISIDSPLGKSVFGKKQGDNFKYVVENAIISGRIDDVIKLDDKEHTR